MAGTRTANEWVVREMQLQKQIEDVQGKIVQISSDKFGIQKDMHEKIKAKHN